MAIGDPFDVQFNRGDVLYGISQARAPYINSLPGNLVTELRADGDYVICDEFNNRTFNKTNNDYGLLEGPSSKKNIRANVRHHRETEYLTPRQKATLKQYYDALKGSKSGLFSALDLK